MPIILTLLGSPFASCASTNVQSFERNKNGITVFSSSGAMRIEVCGDRIIHILASPTREISPAIVPTAIRHCDDSAFNIASDSFKVTIQTNAVQVSVNRATGAIRFLSAAGNTILSEPEGGGRKLTQATIDGTATFHLQQKFVSPPDEALYGLGQHQEGFLNMRGIPLRLQQSNTNISVPVLLSTKGYGLLWNNASLTDFNPADRSIELDPRTGEASLKTGAAGEYGFLLTGNRKDRLHLTINGKAIIDIENMWVADSAGAKIYLKANTKYKISAHAGADAKLFVRPPASITEFRSDAGRAVDYYFFYGPELNRVIQEYRNVTGEAPLLPRWAYGFWQCRERYSSQQQILSTAAEFRTRKIPVDAIVQDWQYWGKYGWNAMRFDESSYPDPVQMTAKLHMENLHLIASVWAKFGTKTSVDQVMKKDGLLLASEADTGEPGEAKAKEDWVDMFNPRAQALFWSEMNRGLFRDGLDGWWLDASEPEGDPLKGVSTYLGPGEFVRNAYPLYETTAVYRGQRATTDQKRVVILTRSAFAGQQRNAAISWSGDISANWETLRRQIPAGLSFNMSGLPYWTTDIGGFFRPKDQYTSGDYHELLIRWFEFGTFCPIFRIHGYKSETEMWKYGSEVEQVLRRYDELRYRLLPYIYSEAWGVTSRGESIMRALPLEYQNQRSLREIGDQFLFGDSLLINPVTQKGATKREVVLPAGTGWVNFWTGQINRGGSKMLVDAPLAQIPIFVKQGTILPLGPIVQSAAEMADPLEIRVYGGRDADFLLYEDDGDGYAYERENKATIGIHWDDKQNTLVIGQRSGKFSDMSNKRTLRIVLVHKGHGVGMQPEERADRVLTYDGSRMIIHFP